MTSADESWVVADSAWCGRGRRVGPCALPVRAGLPGAGATVPGELSAVGAPVPVDAVPPGAAVRRLAGTLLPGLHDEHVHAGLADLTVVRAHGIAVCHDLGGSPVELARQRARPGMPRLQVVGAFLTAPGGYPSDRSWAVRASWRPVHGREDAVTAVAEQVAAGAVAIKVAVHLDAGPVLTPPVVRAVVDAAHAAGLPVVVHAEGRGATARALDDGADRLAHTPWTEALDPGLVRACAERLTWISSLDIHGWGAPTAQESADQETATRNLRAFLEQGGRVRYGTDLGNGPLPLGVNAREVRALLSCGMTADDVLASMTDTVTDADTAVPPCWVPGGLPGLDGGPDAGPAAFAAALATARVLGGPGEPPQVT